MDLESYFHYIFPGNVHSQAHIDSHLSRHLHVIVGRGNHSENHIPKIKPKVEQVCQELGLPYVTESNEGRIYIKLQGGLEALPPINGHDGGQNHGGQQGYPGQQGNRVHEPNNQNDELEQLGKKFLLRSFKKLDGCCNVM
jgi:hypothetical protein